MPGESYEHLVILDGKMEIIKIYESKNTSITTDNDNAIFTTKEKFTILDIPQTTNKDDKSNNTKYVVIMKNDKYNIAYKGKEFLISNDEKTITLNSVIIAKITEFTNNAGEINKKICEKINRTIKLLLKTEQSSSCEDNLKQNTIKLIDEFNTLVNKVVYNIIIVKILSSAGSDTFKDLKLQNVDNNAQIEINIQQIINDIMKIDYNQALFTSINSSIEKLLKDKKINQRLLLLQDPEKNIRGLLELFLKLKKFLNIKSNDGVVNEFQNNVSEYVSELIEYKISTFENLYTLDNANHNINEFINLITTPINSKQIDDTYIKDSNKRLITYIKINNTESSDVINSMKAGERNTYRYNERFNILINNTTYSSMKIQYNSHTMKYYDDSPDTKDKLTKFTSEIPKDYISNDEIVKYDYTYTYGHFSKIFTPDIDNEAISEQMQEVKTMLTQEDPKPVFIIGYGSSGAGKTSSLIYYNKGEGKQKDGVLIWLLKDLCKDEVYDKVSFYIQEFDVYHAQKPVRTPSNDDKITYNYNSGSFKLDESNLNQIKPFISGDKRRNKYRTTDRNLQPNSNAMSVLKKVKKNQDKLENPNFKYNVDEINSNTDIGDILIRLIDTNRFVKATTNNPNSSRSHVVVYVELTSSKGHKPGHIYIGDFAGVENKFGCDDINVVQRFLDIPRDNEKQTDGTLMKKPTRYYSTELTNIKGEPDYKFGGGDKLYHDMTIGLNKEYIEGKLAEIDRNYNKEIDFSNDKATTLCAEDIFNFIYDNTENYITFLNDIKDVDEDIVEDPQGNYKVKVDITKNSVNKSFVEKRKNIIGVNEISDITHMISGLYQSNKTLEGLNNTKSSSGSSTPASAFFNYKTENIKNFVSMLFPTDDTVNYTIMIKRTDIQENFIHKLDMQSSNIDNNFYEMAKSLLNLPNTIESEKCKTAINCKISTNNKEVNEMKNIHNFINNKLLNAKSDNGISFPLIYNMDSFKKETNPNIYIRGLFVFSYRTDGGTEINNKYVKTPISSNIDINYNTDNTYFFTYILKCDSPDHKKQNILVDKITILIPSNLKEEFKNKYGTDDIQTLLNKHTDYALKTKFDNIDREIKNLNSNITSQKEAIKKGISGLNEIYGKVKKIYQERGYELKNEPSISDDAFDKIGPATDTAPPSNQSSSPRNDPSVNRQSNRPKTGTNRRGGAIDDEYKTPTETITKIKTFIDFFMKSNIFTLSPNFEIFSDRVFTKYAHGYIACQNREKEGDYINSSLRDIRKTIDIMMPVKNENKFVAPAFIPECYNSYCPTGIDCFKPKKLDNTQSIPSLIFQSIYDDLKYDSKEKFYKDILVCLFCVFNIARSANNPPTSRYIDINELKYFMATKGQLLSKGQQENTNVYSNFKDIIGRIYKNLFNTEYNESTGIQDTNGLLTYNVADTNTYQYILKDIDAYLNDKTTNFSKIKSDSPEIIDYIIEYITQSKIIERFDNFNAASTIGTLDFADRFAKMNMVENTCTKYNIENKDRKKIDSEGDYKQLDQKEYHQLLRK